MLILLCIPGENFLKNLKKKFKTRVGGKGLCCENQDIKFVCHIIIFFLI